MASFPFRVTAATLDVVAALLEPDDELYGLRIAQNAGRKTGTVYPILARLEEAGWVHSFWELDEPSARGPRRRFYRLNPDFLGAARELVADRAPQRSHGWATRWRGQLPRPAGER